MKNDFSQFDVALKAYYYRINVRDAQHNLVETLFWQDMPIAVRLKWDWYFIYRAALLQVKYPRHTVEQFHGSEEATGQTLIHNLTNKITAKKAKLTQWRSKLAAFQCEFDTYQRSYTKLFPIAEDPQYQAYSTQLAQAEIKINNLAAELETLQASLNLELTKS